MTVLDTIDLGLTLPDLELDPGLSVSGLKDFATGKAPDWGSISAGLSFYRQLSNGALLRIFGEGDLKFEKGNDALRGELRLGIELNF